MVTGGELITSLTFVTETSRSFETTFRRMSLSVRMPIGVPFLVARTLPLDLSTIDFAASRTELSSSMVRSSRRAMVPAGRSNTIWENKTLFYLTMGKIAAGSELFHDEGYFGPRLDSVGRGEP